MPTLATEKEEEEAAAAESLQDLLSPCSLSLHGLGAFVQCVGLPPPRRLRQIRQQLSLSSRLPTHTLLVHGHPPFAAAAAFCVFELLSKPHFARENETYSEWDEEKSKIADGVNSFLKGVRQDRE